jgi:hypothetical protein
MKAKKAKGKGRKCHLPMGNRRDVIYVCMYIKSVACQPVQNWKISPAGFQL